MSTYSYSCIELNAHALIYSIIQLKNKNLPHLFQTHLFESQQCENLFRQVRSFTSTYSTVANCSVKEILGRISKIQHQSDIANMIGSNYTFPHLDRIQSRHNQTFFDLPGKDQIQNVIEKAKNDALHDAMVFDLVHGKEKNNKKKVDLSCPINPFAKVRRGDKNKVNKQRVHEEYLQQCHKTSFGIDFEHINLKNVAHKFNGNDIDENSGFVEVFKNIHKRIVVKKTSLCWLLRGDYARLSSDRLERVKENARKKKNKTHIYNLRTLNKRTKYHCTNNVKWIDKNGH